VNLAEAIFEVVEGAKNSERERQVPLIAEALESMKWLLERWKEMGGNQPEEYVLPLQPRAKNAHTNLNRPMSSIKRSWNIFKKEVALANPELYRRIKDFRIYDCRVTKITRTLASGKVSIHTAKKLFGHVSESMQRRYYKPDHELLRKAMAVAHEPKDKEDKQA
jgi:integrase